MNINNNHNLKFLSRGDYFVYFNHQNTRVEYIKKPYIHSKIGRIIYKIKVILNKILPIKILPIFSFQVYSKKNLQEAINNLAHKTSIDNYDNEIDTAVEAMISLIEPIMIVFLGGSVGAIVIALFMPLVKLMGSIG